MPPAGGLRTSLTERVQTGPLAGAWGPYSPGDPLVPLAPEAVRAWDFPSGVNAVLTPRAYEPFSFRELRAFANVELVRLAIETRKDQLERLDWSIKPRIETPTANAPADPRLARLTAFWRRPDGATPFATWLRLLLEDLLVLDAPALERRRNRAGELIGLDVIPGDSIHPMVDETGRRPRGPDAIAYQQVIKGKITIAQAFSQAETWLGQTEARIEKAIAGDPAVQAAVNTVIADGKAAITVGADWAGTAMSGGLSSFADELSGLVARYVPQLVGASGGPFAAAAVTAIQALGQVGIAAIQHEVATVISGAGADPAPTPAAAPTHAVA